MVRCLLVFTAALLVAASVPHRAHSQPATDTTRVVIKGRGAAHGFGLAMDGVEGQARAGWDHDKILSLFYPGTENSTKSGTIRVGLVELGGGQRLTLPAGGEISDRPFSSGAGDGYPIRISSGGAVEIQESGGGLTLRTDGADSGAQAAGGSERGSRYAQVGQQEEPLLSPLPSLAPTPTPTPKKPPASDPEPRPAPPKVSSFWVRGSGDPALVGVDATGRRYRGVMEVRRIGGGSTRVVNHVDLETYVAGIAEEKGQGWPLEGLKVLAVAARTLGAATMTWHSKQHDKGYDICPSSNCQVYLGYDGEEPALRRAVAETAGKIRTFDGRALMAMYHGNGGGQTETYGRVTEGRGQPHPYLRSVKYPHADPSSWEKQATLSEIAGALRGQGVKVPSPLQLVAVTERGDSPRVLRLRIAGGRDEQTTVRGATFKTALGLRSTWFDIEIPREAEPAVIAGLASVGKPAKLPPRAVAAATSSSFPWLPTVAGAGATILVAAAALLVAQGAGTKRRAVSNRWRRLARRVRRPSSWRGP